jgi:hypothetical protein
MITAVAVKHHFATLKFTTPVFSVLSKTFVNQGKSPRHMIGYQGNFTIMHPTRAVACCLLVILEHRKYNEHPFFF